MAKKLRLSPYGYTEPINLSPKMMESSKDKGQSSDIEKLKKATSGIQESISGMEETIASAFQGVSYDSESKEIQFTSESGEVVGSIDASDFIKDGMIEDVTYNSETKKLDITFNTDGGSKTISVDLSDLFELQAGDGVYVEGNKIAIKLDEEGESFLTLSENGLKLDGILDAIDEQVSASTEEFASKISEEEERATAKENEIIEALDVESQRATAAESELQGKDAELQAKIDEVDSKKVDWVESEGGRKHIVLKNHDNMLGTATDGGTYNLAMVSKWDVADFGSAQLHANLNSKDGNVTINDDKVIATEQWVESKGYLTEHQDISDLATKQEVADAAAEAVAKVVADAPEDLDTLKEVAQYIASDNTRAAEIQAKLDSHDAAIVELKAKDEELSSLKADKSELEPLAIKEEVNAELLLKADKSELEPLAVKEDVNAELLLKADKSELESLATKEEVNAVDAKFTDYASIERLDTEVARATAKENELQDKVDEIEAKKVDWTESTEGRKHIVLKNHDSVLGTATNGSTYNVAMVSKWDVADFGSAQLHANLNSKDGNVTINDNKVIATKDEVEAVDAKVNAIDLAPYAKVEAVNAELANKANAADLTAAVNALTEKDNELEASISQAAANAVAQVVANAPSDFDTLKEVADYIASDKTKAAEIETKLAELTAKDASQDEVINGKTDKVMNGTNGKALIFNETDGGGAKFEHNDGTWSFAGVNDGGENGIAGQIYALKKNASNKMEGTRIDVTKGAMYYTVGDAGATERLVAENEIAVKGDVNAVNAKVDALVIPSIEGLAKSSDVTAEIAAAVEPLATKEEVALKADSSIVYTQEEVDALLIAKEKEIYNLTKIVGNMGGAVTYELPNEIGNSFNSLMANNGTVKLTDDVTTGRFGPGVLANNTVKLNLNNHNLNISGLTISSSTPAIASRGTENITIGGKGTIDAGEGMCIMANGADSVINLTGSTTVYKTNRSGGELIYCYAGTINITNGTFINNGEEKKFTLNCYDANYRNGTAKIVVTGGKFYDFDPGNNTAEGENTSFLADGYVSVQSTEEIDGITHNVYTVKKA